MADYIEVPCEKCLTFALCRSLCQFGGITPVIRKCSIMAKYLNYNLEIGEFDRRIHNLHIIFRAKDNNIDTM